MAYDYSDLSFESRLTDGTDRFLAHTVEHSLAIGRRTSRDFLRHFPPKVIMDALKDLPALRADILEAATGVRRKIAMKKSARSAGDDLQIALDEGEALTDEVVSLFRPDDRVRYLRRAALWSFLVEGEFWQVDQSSKTEYEQAQLHIAFMLDRALQDEVLSHQQIVDGIGIGRIAQLLPRTQLETALQAALTDGRNGKPFADRDLYQCLTATHLTDHIPLAHIWEQVIQPCVALEQGLLGAQAREAGATSLSSRRESATGSVSTSSSDSTSTDNTDIKPIAELSGSTAEHSTIGNGRSTDTTITTRPTPPIPNPTTDGESRRYTPLPPPGTSAGDASKTASLSAKPPPSRRGLLANSHPNPTAAAPRLRSSAAPPSESTSQNASDLQDDVAFDLAFDEELILGGTSNS